MLKLAERKPSMLLPDGTTEPLTLSAAENCYQAQFTPQKAGTYQVVVVNDTRAVQDWTKRNLGIVRPREYLRAICQVGSTVLTIMPIHYLDVTPETGLASGKPATLLVTKDGVAYANAPVKLTTPDGKQNKQTADAAGPFTLTPTGPGQYVVDVDFMDKTPGQYQGKDYQAVRNKMLKLWPPADGNDANGCLPILLRMSVMPFVSATFTGRLLCLLLVCFDSLSSGSGTA